MNAFVHQHFAPPCIDRSAYVCTPGVPLVQHIDALWPVLTREPATHPAKSSLLPLPHAYVVPGGRFVEMYYWDSYFTMLGLAQSGRAELVHAITERFFTSRKALYDAQPTAQHLWLLPFMAVK